jgi:hypothetical protein
MVMMMRIIIIMVVSSMYGNEPLSSTNAGNFLTSRATVMLPTITQFHGFRYFLRTSAV